MDFTKVEFIKSAVSEAGFIRDGKPQIAFVGRSNVGKSSVINTLVRRKNFARVGAQPGKTSQVNYFLIDRKFYITDLPGYGYAKVSKAERDRWGKLMESYFTGEELISMGVMIVDARHKPTADDVTMAEWFKASKCPVIVVVNKTDKTKKSEIADNMSVIRDTLALGDETVYIPFSAEKGNGRAELIKAIDRFLAGVN